MSENEEERVMRFLTFQNQVPLTLAVKHTLRVNLLFISLMIPLKWRK